MSDGATTECAFCGKVMSEEEISLEHLFRRAFRGKMGPLATTSIYRSRHRDAQGQTQDEKIIIRASGYGVTVRGVCKSCNRDVLNNRIEQPFEKVLLELMHGKHIALDSTDMMRLAVWASKTAMVRELLDGSRGVPSIPTEYYRLLRDHLLPMPNTFIFFGMAENTPDTFHRHRRFSLEGNGLRGRGFQTTLVAGHLWLLLAGFDSRALYEASWIEADTQNIGHSRELVRFWPPEAEEIDEARNRIRLRPREFPFGPAVPSEIYRAISNRHMGVPDPDEPFESFEL